MGARYLIMGGSAIHEPKEIVFYEPPDLKSSDNGADIIIITHQDFLATAQILANYRQQQGYRALVVDVEDVYNLFNEGIYHPIAIKNFMKYTFAYCHPPAVSTVILVGDGHWNFKRNNPGNYGSTPVFMPPNLAWVDPWQGEVDTSNLLVNIIGDDPMPDLSIG